MACRETAAARARRILVGTLILALVPTVTSAAVFWPDAYALTARLGILGERPPGSAGHRAARVLLMETLQGAGLEQVEIRSVSGHPQLANLTGVVPGDAHGTIVISAHYDTVEGSPGALDDASGCAVVVATAARLVRDGLRHPVRVLLFDGEEGGLYGSRAWAESLGRNPEDRILAMINLEMVGRRDVEMATAHLFPVTRRVGPSRAGASRVLAPAWLVRRVLAAGQREDFRLAVTDPLLPVLGQLAQRQSEIKFGADSEAALEVGIPAILLSDASFSDFEPTYHTASDLLSRVDRNRMTAWVEYLTTLVRTIDAVGAGERSQSYLVLANRVWLGGWLRIGGWILAGLVLLRGAARLRLGSVAVLASLACAVAGAAAFLFSPLSATGLITPALLVELVRPNAVPWRARWLMVAGFLSPAAYLLLLALGAARGFIQGVLWEPAAIAAIALTLAAHAWGVSLGLTRPGRRSGRSTAPSTAADASPETP